MYSAKKKNRLIWVWALCFSLVIILAVAGCNGEEIQNGSVEQDDTPGIEEEEERSYGIGETGRTDKLEITVTKGQKATEWATSPPEDHEYVIVSLKIKNISKEEQSVGAGEFGIVKEDGTRGGWENFTGVKTDPDTFGGAHIAPGETFEGSLIFASPIAISHVEIHYRKGYTLTPDLKFEFEK
ncbi:MAG: DUF4352 domain-containing protein [Firmicutes bacterium]|nr:DUF4352 domain-containing protein [Bacillota bacterium]